MYLYHEFVIIVLDEFNECEWIIRTESSFEARALVMKG